MLSPACDGGVTFASRVFDGPSGSISAPVFRDVNIIGEPTNPGHAGGVNSA
jgi:hypothetical protein